MAAPAPNQPQVDEIFKNSQWRAQAEQPGALEKIGHKWDEFITTKGQGVKSYLGELQLAYKMLRDPNFQIDTQTKMVLVIALLYVVSPIDLVPDAIPLLGLLDDVLVAGYALKQAAGELERYRKTVPTP
jgi:uncharacterized membrane protein YkvA (DUF1232 family)